MAIDKKTEKELSRFVENLRNSREEAIQQLAASEQRIRDLQNALSDYEDQKKGRGVTIEDTDTVEYTYKPGDTFGQVITDLGLKTDNGLWGADGDVAYYTKQLADQGLWGNGQPGNIPVGTTIKLRRRGTTGGTSDEKETLSIAEDLDRAEQERVKAQKEVEEIESKTKETEKALRNAAKKESNTSALESAALIQAIRTALKNRR